MTSSDFKKPYEATQKLIISGFLDAVSDLPDVYIWNIGKARDSVDFSLSFLVRGATYAGSHTHVAICANPDQFGYKAGFRAGRALIETVQRQIKIKAA